MFSANLANMFGQQQTAALQGAGQFGLGQQQMQMQPLLQLLQGALFGGGVTQDPAFVQNPGTFGQIMGLALPAAGFLLGGPMGGMAGAAAGQQFAGKTELVRGGSSMTPMPVTTPNGNWALPKTPPPGGLFGGG